jgi:hypothetical protein
MMEAYELWNLYTGTHTYFKGKPSVDQIQGLFEDLSFNDAMIVLNEGRLVDERVGDTVLILESFTLVDGKHKEIK